MGTSANSKNLRERLIEIQHEFVQLKAVLRKEDLPADEQAALEEFELALERGILFAEEYEAHPLPAEAEIASEKQAFIDALMDDFFYSTNNDTTDPPPRSVTPQERAGDLAGNPQFYDLLRKLSLAVVEKLKPGQLSFSSAMFDSFIQMVAGGFSGGYQTGQAALGFGASDQIIHVVLPTVSLLLANKMEQLGVTSLQFLKGKVAKDRQGKHEFEISTAAAEEAVRSLGYSLTQSETAQMTKIINKILSDLIK